MAAAQMAAAGRRVVVCDEKLAWEKPCGGGVTDKALARYPFLREAQAERRWIYDCELIGPDDQRVLLRLERPIAIFSRQVLNALLLERARLAGAELARERVIAIERSAQGGGWHLKMRSGASLEASFVVLATGARNSFRSEFQLPFTSADFMTALGYYVPGECERLQVKFAAGLGGYLWTFPRPGHISAGICGPAQPQSRARMAPGFRARLGAGFRRRSNAAARLGPSAGEREEQSAAALRRQLEQFLDREGLAWRGSRFYAHLLPAPRLETLRALRFAGPDWALAGDAAGLVDPLTGEGLYYALRSGELLAAAYLRGQPARYQAALRGDFLPDLELAARIADRFYHGQFLGAGVIERMLQFTAASRRFQALMRDLFAGSQGYIGLKRRLYRNLLPTLAEVLAAR